MAGPPPSDENTVIGTLNPCHGAPDSSTELLQISTGM